MESDEQFYRIQKLPPYVFAVINEMKAKARAAQLDVVDLGMGNPDGAAPRAVVSKLVEAARNPRNHRYSMSRGIPRLREEIVKRYNNNYGRRARSGKRSHRHHRRQGRAGAPAVRRDRPGRRGGFAESRAIPIHQYGVIMAEGHACMLPMPDPATFLERAGGSVQQVARKPPR